MGVPAARRDRTHYLYLAVIGAVALGILVGFVAPGFAVELKPIGTGFVNLIKMMISPIIFCTIVLGVGSVRKAAKVGAVGGLALGYFLVMSTVALAIGLLVGNILEPGQGLHLTEAVRAAGEKQAAGASESTVDFLLGIIPTTMVSAFTEGEVLQTLLVALLAGFALQAMGSVGEPVLRGIGHIQRLVFRVLAMIMWAAPVGAFGAMAAVVGETGVDALKSLAIIMVGFYITCAIFVFVVLGTILRVVAGVNLLLLLKYLGREFLLILSTSSSESALPRLIAKMEHLGVSKSVAGITVPTGYSFNLDGTAIYLTMSSLFIANAMGDPLSAGEQVSLLLFMIVASKGAAGVTGAGLATLAGGLQSHRPGLVDGVGLIVGIDRFMSEARALTNFAGNAVATVLVGTWTKEIDRERVDQVLAGAIPFDEKTLTQDDPHGATDVPEPRDGGAADVTAKV
ncbi:cation:dicarboxylase symporter family transporter [Streptomyces sp. NBC_01707]|uniref:cation:dicarboxylate symporter family transporter n=1 Tax=unclassified Streptomyces TaxID=2593676 RepID=UPI00087ED25D|nr:MULTISPECIES: cation:dicarboxylase symporter family transporter [unclassified Streptomyces]MDX3765869.1 cation:dicarboxylase symporter family transporter [Streptomyces sp. AK08-01B]MDX3815958.1 cation:dicarboxylase symporter family transporter [Streptomyces sp. AK08-01A]SCY47588.1 aerobic C4-dicarboxylate transport protein [Streptomyces sp. 136MFCol5.1]SFS60989.1 aerobic C4-dicarboxylate transport protein [Streptomyces sp. ok210]